MMQKSSILIITLLVLTGTLLLGSYFLSFTLGGLKIARIQDSANKSYYLAEAGINELIWKLKNDSAWKDNFENNCAWQSESLIREDIFSPGDSYQTYIQNSDCGKGEIISKGLSSIGGGKSAQRIVKTKVFKALNPGPIEDVGFFSDNKIDISNTTLQVQGVDTVELDGSIFANDKINITNSSDVSVENKVSSVKDINVSLSSTLTANEILPNIGHENKQDMPQIDFNEPGSVESYESIADYKYTAQEFNTLLWDNPDLTLNGIIYVSKGNIDIRGGQSLTVNGVLVSEGLINVGKDLCWTYDWKNPLETRCGNSSLVVNHNIGDPSGVISKGRINIRPFISGIDLTGLVYGLNGVFIYSPGKTINITGGILARRLDVWTYVLGQNINLTYDPSLVNQALRAPKFSPVITIEHWEELY